LTVKGIRELWTHLNELSNDFPEWELHCIGTGDLWDKRAIHPKIVHHGFKQPDELAAHLEDAACFVMPSKKEPWGVVLHEMAIAGLPLLVSDQVGAASMFLKSGANGFVIGPTTQGIRNVLFKLLQMSTNDLLAMGKQSRLIAASKMPSNWVRALLAIV
jgi:glycosyltransferase involved in cell wall biosynthesis